MANTWFAFKGYNNNKAINASIFDMTELDAIGMHGYPTEAQANAKPNSVNIFQAPVVNAAIDDANNARDVASAPGNVAGAAGKAVAGGASAVFGDFTKWLNQSNLLLRGAEIAAGLLLIYIGVKAAVTPGGATTAARSGKQTAHSAAGALKTLVVSSPVGKERAIRSEARAAAHRTVRAKRVEARTGYELQRMKDSTQARRLRADQARQP